MPAQVCEVEMPKSLLQHHLSVLAVVVRVPPIQYVVAVETNSDCKYVHSQSKYTVARRPVAHADAASEPVIDSDELTVYEADVRFRLNDVLEIVGAVQLREHEYWRRRRRLLSCDPQLYSVYPFPYCSMYLSFAVLIEIVIGFDAENEILFEENMPMAYR